MNQRSGFTLVELLIYASIFAFISVALTSIFISFLKTDIQETASVEVSSQANFILQRLQNYISNAGFLVVRDDDADDETDVGLALPHGYLIIKDRSESENNEIDTNSPIVIYRDTTDNNIKVKQGKPSGTITILNTDKVLINKLTFTKVKNPPGRDVVSIDLGVEYRNPTITQKVIRNYSLGVGKAFAAVFDTGLTPSSTILDIGTSSYPWRNLFLSGKLEVDTSIKLGTNISNNPNLLIKFYHGVISGVSIPAITGYANQTLSNIILTNVPSTDGTERIFLTPKSMPDNIIYIGAVAKSDLANGKVDIFLRNTSSTASSATTNDWNFWLVR